MRSLLAALGAALAFAAAPDARAGGVSHYVDVRSSDVYYGVHVAPWGYRRHWYERYYQPAHVEPFKYYPYYYYSPRYIYAPHYSLKYSSYRRPRR